jgi:MFS family permease
MTVQAAEAPMRAGLLPMTRLAFMTSGYAISSWAPLIPAVKTRIGLSAGELGLTLLAFGAGSMTTMLVAGPLVGRIGCRRLFSCAGFAIAAVLPCLPWMESAPALAVALCLFGAAMGLISCARNLHGLATERRLGRRLMSGFHGFYSVGCILGAGTMSVLMGLGVPPWAAIAAVALVLALAVVASAPYITDERAGTGPAFVAPHGIVLGIGLLCFIVFMAEGSVLDWSAILLTGHFHLDAARAGLGFVACATTMTVGRLSGDWLVRRLGDRILLSAGPVMAAAGFALATLPLHWTLSVAGFALAGAGLANVVPLLYSAVGRQTIMPANLALTAAGSIGFAGILSGPAAIGFIAQATSLSTAFLILAACLLVVARVTPGIVRV